MMWAPPIFRTAGAAMLALKEAVRCRPIMMAWITGLAFLVLCALPDQVRAHEVRPAYLEISLRGGEAVVLWKQPVAGELALPLSPVLSNGWTSGVPGRIARSTGYLLKEWRSKAGDEELAGLAVSIDGLDRSITDVLVRIDGPGGLTVTRVLRPGASSFVVKGDNALPRDLGGTVKLGIEHILSGTDHLLFVAALMVLVRRRRTMVWTLTAFTIGHSVTLAAALLGYVAFDPVMVEILIALSVLILAVDIVYSSRGKDTLASRRPWLVAGGFGLVHGLGFAGSLSRAGLPAEDVAGVLLGFNIGVELGQLAFVALILAIASIAGRAITWPARAALVPAYFIGAIAAYWVIERVADVV